MLALLRSLAVGQLWLFPAVASLEVADFVAN
jgi:hypothetical protein